MLECFKGPWGGIQRVFTAQTSVQRPGAWESLAKLVMPGAPTPCEASRGQRRFPPISREQPWLNLTNLQLPVQLAEFNEFTSTPSAHLAEAGRVVWRTPIDYRGYRG